ncbi:hypothetical protein Elgi_09830 [Paenibacillus elgii]|nr:hypothetical protein Elgi_09830 [Paenibacillus elgii]
MTLGTCYEVCVEQASLDYTSVGKWTNASKLHMKYADNIRPARLRVGFFAFIGKTAGGDRDALDRERRAERSGQRGYRSRTALGV